MANLASAYLETHPELQEGRLSRSRYALHSERDGMVTSHIFTVPLHFRRNGKWREIDTRLRPVGDSFRPTGIPLTFSPDGTVTHRLFQQRSLGFGQSDGQQYYPIAKFGNVLASGDRMIEEGVGWEHSLIATTSGYREELILNRLPALDKPFLALLTKFRGNLQDPRFGEPLVWDAAGRVITAQRFLRNGMIYTLVPRAWLEKAQFPVTVDPDYGEYTDWIAQSFNATYATARTGGTKNAYTPGQNPNGYVGQSYNGSVYTIWHLALKFNTSAIPEGDTITQVNLRLAVYAAQTEGTNFNVTIRRYNWAAYDPLSDSTNLSNFVANFWSGSNEDLNIWRSTNGAAVDGIYTSGNLDTTWVNKGGTTYYGLASSRDRDSTAPTTTNERIGFYRAGSSAAYAPTLIVLHSAASTDKTINAVAGAGTLDAPLPTITTAKQSTITSVVAAATAGLPMPTITAVKQKTITAAIAAAIAGLPLPTIAVTTSQNVQLIVPGAALATLALPAPTIVTTSVIDKIVQAVTTPVTLAMLAPTILVVNPGITVEALIATAHARVLAPQISVQQQPTIFAVVVAATAAFPVPRVLIIAADFQAAVTDFQLKGNFLYQFALEGKV